LRYEPQWIAVIGDQRDECRYSVNPYEESGYAVSCAIPAETVRAGMEPPTTLVMGAAMHLREERCGSACPAEARHLELTGTGRQGVPASHVYVLFQGRVEVRRPTEGGLGLLGNDLLAGGIFGVSSLALKSQSNQIE
jgi:CRP-like cAMP-binding protein